MRATLDVVTGREAFLRLRTEWDAALAAGPDPSPALEHDNLRIWLENFAPSRTPVVVVARDGARLAGALGLLVGNAVVDGVPVRLAEGWTNAHSTRGGPLLGAPGVAIVEPLVLRALAVEFDALSLRDVPREGGVLEAVVQGLEAAGCSVRLEAPMDSPYVVLAPTWEEQERRLGAHFRQNLRRRRRRLEEHGPVSVEVVTGGDGLDRAIEDAFEIEASGWKGREGSAMRARPETVGFYASWIRRLARDGRLRLAFLKVGEARVAFQFAHVTGRRWYLPKTAFDERFREYGPGQLLTAEVLRRCIEEEHLETFEFLGFSMPWKTDWTPLVRPHASVWAFRPTWRGRAAALMRGTVRPRVGALARRVRAWRARGGGT